MAVLVLMYHRTPRDEVTSHWDTPLGVFRDQMRTLLEQGVRFIPFRDAMDPKHYGPVVVVSVTFDDGHETNLDALEVLAELGVVGTALVITDRLDNHHEGFFDWTQARRAAQLGDLGGHGASHTGLSSLAPTALADELRRSKAALEDLTQGRVTTMTLPGGQKSPAVVTAARTAGFEVIGSSVDLMNFKPAHPLHRVCLGLNDDAGAPLRLVRRHRTAWMLRAARLNAASAVHRLMGR